MRRYIGQCQNCGSPEHPKGNVFTVMAAAYYMGCYEVPKSELIKVCNNCDFPHSFNRRQSKSKRKMQAYLDSLE